MPIQDRSGNFITENVDEFLANLDREFKVKIPEISLNVIRETVVEVVEKIGEIPWRKTGLWLGSTNISLNETDHTIPTAPFRTPGRAEAEAGMEGGTIEDRFIVTLPEPYTRRLEVEGISKKAPPYSVLAVVESVTLKLRSEKRLTIVE